MLNKQTIHQACEEFVSTKVKALQSQLDELALGISSDSKSTAGDKHETARAMAHLEQERIASQLQSANDLKAKLAALYNAEVSDQVRQGSLIQTNQGWFYLAVALGKINLSGEVVFVLSPQSPLGALLLGKKPGDEVLLNKMKYQILAIQ